MKANCRIYVNNFNAQIKKADPPGWYYSREEAAAEIIAMFYDRMDDEASRHADSVADFDEEHDKWHAAYSEYFEEVKRDIVDGGSYEDGDGHRYGVKTEEDEEDSESGHDETDGPFFVAVVRSFYGPREEMGFAEDDGGDRIEFESHSDAAEWIEEFHGEPYRLRNNEIGRPECLILGQDSVDWLDFSDCSKYDWVSCDCDSADDAPCGICDKCVEWMRAQDISYARDHEIVMSGR